MLRYINHKPFIKPILRIYIYIYIIVFTNLASFGYLPYFPIPIPHLVLHGLVQWGIQVLDPIETGAHGGLPAPVKSFIFLHFFLIFWDHGPSSGMIPSFPSYSLDSQLLVKSESASLGLHGASFGEISVQGSGSDRNREATTNQRFSTEQLNYTDSTRRKLLVSTQIRIRGDLWG